RDAARDETLSPSERLDAVWHVVLLHTARYRELCEAFARRFVDHWPERAGEALARARAERYARTLALYRAHVQVAPPAAWWPEAHGAGAAAAALDDGASSDDGCGCVDGDGCLCLAAEDDVVSPAREDLAAEFERKRLEAL